MNGSMYSMMKKDPSEEGYWCIICQRLLERDEDGIVVHDNVPHPEDMRFDEEDNPQ